MMPFFRNYRPQKPQSNFEKAMQLSQGNPSEFKAQFAALNDGFQNVNDRALNRVLRDNFESKLSGMGITDYNSAYSKLSGGQSLTSNATLFNMINNVGSLTPQEKTNSGNADPNQGTSSDGGDEISDYENQPKGYEDLIDQLDERYQSDPMQAVGGPGSALDGGATGFRRKRSSARMAGLTNKGTSALKITGQTSKSSGLNIG